MTALPPGTLLPPTVGICYDLIPFLRPNAYLTSARCRSWYYRRLLQMRHMAGLLAISEWSRGEAVGRFGYPPEDVTNILAGVGPQFRPERDSDEAEAALLARYGLQPGFILCIGAVDPRKNLDGLIRAYALLPPTLRQKHRLVATGWNDTSQLRPLHALAAASGLAAGEITLLTDFVPEHDLPGLYRASVLSISPSLHEGFGLSAAEAMACGVPVIGSNTTSLPEVIGRAEALFNPADPADIAARLTQVLTDPALREELGRYGLARSTEVHLARHGAARLGRDRGDRGACCGTAPEGGASVPPRRRCAQAAHGHHHAALGGQRRAHSTAYRARAVLRDRHRLERSDAG